MPAMKMDQFPLHYKTLGTFSPKRLGSLSYKGWGGTEVLVSVRTADSAKGGSDDDSPGGRPCVAGEHAEPQEPLSSQRAPTES